MNDQFQTSSNGFSEDQIKEAVRRFLFGETRANPFERPEPIRVLIVDDEPFVLDAVRMMFGFEGVAVESALSGKEGLEKFDRGRFDVVITDYAMPFMKGDEFALEVKHRAPHQPVLMISAYAEFLMKEGAELKGVDLLLSKPFLLDDLRDSLAKVLSLDFTGPIQAIYAKQTGIHFVLNGVASALSQILASMRSHTDVAESMIRHKAKNLVHGYLDKLSIDENLFASTERLRDQLRSLMRMSVRARLIRQGPFSDYLRKVLADLPKEHVKVRVRSEVDHKLDSLTIEDGRAALLALITCELIDNAVDAINRDGEVQVEAHFLQSKQAICVRVRDSGLGLTKEAEKKVFKEHFSTKGSGRGMGLFLAMEGMLKLAGTIEYHFDSGACFTSIVPIADRGTEHVKEHLDVRQGRENGSVSVACSYSHRDEPLRNELFTHLSALQRQGLISTWHDRKIEPGQKWAEVIASNFATADIVIMLVSADFLASDYCQEIEMRIAVERAFTEQTTLVPVIVRSCDWQSGVLGNFQALPKDGIPVTNWEKRDDAWLHVAQGIRSIATKPRKRAN